MKKLSTFKFIFFISVSTCLAQHGSVRLNQIQVIGSHNSYKQKIEKPVMDMLLEKSPKYIGLDYYHIPLDEQLTLGLRALEIDVLHDPAGGRYRKPYSLSMLKEKAITALPYDTLHQLDQPGLKVIHVPDVDFRTHCFTFISCLQEIKQWSDKNRNHLPIFITINPKDSGAPEPGFVKVLPFTENVLDSLDAEIRSVFSESQLITPAQVRGRHSSLREAVSKKGWPTLNESLGKILFILDAGEQITEIYTKRKVSTPVMFANVKEDHRDAGVFIMNEPIEQSEQIKKLVNMGYIVRTRSDADTKEARTNDYSRLKAAVESGAQIISTDYYLKKLSPSGEYQITLENGKYEVVKSQDSKK